MFLRLSRTTSKIVVVTLALMLWAAGRVAADTYYVDGPNPSANDANPGTAALPYRTIAAAVTARQAAGTTILVKAGVYREQVTIKSSGTAASPYTVLAESPATVIDGADDFGSPSRWTQVAGDVWLASTVNWSPVQVFANGARLLDSTFVSPTTIPANSCTWVSGTGLYVNVGGGNPGAQQLMVGKRLSAFLLPARSWVTLQGFTITRTEDKSIYLSAAANHCTLASLAISYCGKYGISIVNSSYELIQNSRAWLNADHGVYLTSCDSSVVRNLESWGNWRPRERAANGIYLSHGVGNRFENNNLHHNQDTGLNLYTGANYNICLGNYSWNNGDHGYDNLGAVGNLYIGDLAYKNYKDGWSIEGSSPNNQLYDCIAVDNGFTTTEFNLWVDGTSAVGFQSDYNLFWNSEWGHYPVKYVKTLYSSVSAYTAASGKDVHTLEANPRFANPAIGDFHLLGGSAAIDNGMSGLPYWPAFDADGNPRADDPSVPNAGIGPVTYMDRGPFEHAVGSDLPPVVVAPQSMSVSENQPLVFAVSASDAQPISTLTANLAGLPAGHHATFGSSADATSGTFTWTPAFGSAPGPYTVTFTAANGLSGTTATTISVVHVDRAPTVAAPASTSGTQGAPISVAVTASDVDGDAIASLTANLSGLPAANTAVFTPNPSQTGGTLSWTPTLSDGPGPYTVTFTASNALSGSGATSITVAAADRAPAVTAPATVTVTENQPLRIDVSAADPDGEAIASLTAVLDGLPAGNTASFSSNPSHTAGTLTWTPSFTDAPGPYAITFRAANALSGSATVSVQVLNSDRAPVVTAPATAAATQGQPLTIVVHASDPDSDAIGSLGVDLGTLPSAGGATFTPNADNTRATLTWTPGPTDGSGPYVVTFTAANGLSASAQTSITITNVDAPPSVTAPATASVVQGQKLTLSVTAADPNLDPIATLTADLSALPAGNDAVFVVSASHKTGTLTWTPTLADSARPYTVTFTAANALSGSAVTDISVTPADRAPVLTVPAGVTATENQPLTVTVSASDPDGDALTSLTAALAGLPAGNNATFVPNASNTAGSLTWTPSFADAPGPYVVTFTAANALIATASITISVANVDRAPVVTAPATATVVQGQPLSITVTAADADGDAITSLAANLGALPAGAAATFTPASDQKSGTFTWTPAYYDGPGPWPVSFGAANALTGSAVTAITVQAAPPPPNLCANPSFETDIAGWQSTASATLARVAGGHDGGWALEMRSPAAATATFGIGDQPNWVASSPAAGSRYRFSAWVRSASSHGSTKLKLREYSNSVLQGAVVYSNAIPLTAAWQLMSVDFVTLKAGSTIDLELSDYPVAAGEVFQTDDVSITLLPGADQLPVVLAPPTATATENGQLTVTVTASDPDSQAITSLAVSGLPAGNNASFVTNAAHTQGTLTWTPGWFDGRATPYTVTFTASNTQSGSATTSITVANVDRSPVVTSPATASVAEGQTLTVVIAAADPDSDAIASLTAGLTGLPAGNDAEFTPNATRTGGTLTWTPLGGASRSTPYSVTFTAVNAMSGSATLAITVSPGQGVIPPADRNLCGNPTFETNLNGWNGAGSATTTRVAGGRVDSFAVQVRGATTTGTASMGLNDSPNWIMSIPVAGTRYRFAAWVRSPSNTGQVRIKVREYTPAGVQVGTTIQSAAVTLSPVWQFVSVDVVTGGANNTLDMQVLDAPVVAGETFLVDDVGINVVANSSALAMGRAGDDVTTAITPGGLVFGARMTPNPVYGHATLHFTTTARESVRADLYDTSGRRIRRLLDEAQLDPGEHHLGIDLTDDRGLSLRPGLYFYRLEAREGVRTGRVVLTGQ